MFWTLTSSPAKILETYVEELNRTSKVSYHLDQNYPNPFNPSTSIRYGLPKNSYVKIEIIDMLGRKVRSLVAEVKQAGYHEANWDGLDDNSNKVASGVYLYTMETKGHMETKKLLLIK